jgi:hypothetical protein
VGVMLAVVMVLKNFFEILLTHATSIYDAGKISRTSDKRGAILHRHPA